MIVTAHDPSYFTPLQEPPCSQGLESATFTPPTLDGSVPLPELYDWQYHHNPDHPAFIFDDPSPSNPDDIRVYRWKTVVPIIHRTGRHILSLFNLTLPLNPEHVPVIAVLAAAGIFILVWSKLELNGKRCPQIHLRTSQSTSVSSAQAPRSSLSLLEILHRQSLTCCRRQELRQSLSVANHR